MYRLFREGRNKLGSVRQCAVFIMIAKKIRKGSKKGIGLNRPFSNWITFFGSIPVGNNKHNEAVQSAIRIFVWIACKKEISKSKMTLSVFSLYQSALLACFCFTIATHAGDFLKFENRSNSLVKGCYHESNILALCFHIQPGFLQLTDKRNNLLVNYRRLPNQRFQAQILDQNFIWYNSAAEPLSITAAETALFSSDAEIELAYGLASNALREISPALYKSAEENLRRKQEIQLLPHVSKALHDGAKDYAVTKPFHVMSMSLLMGHDVNSTARDPATTADFHHSAYQKYRDDRKTGSCEDLRRDPNKDNCLGMCGPDCRCWSLVCGNCCYNKGCYQHDRCCRRKAFSGYCLFPFWHQFGCNRYGGYPDCL